MRDPIVRISVGKAVAVVRAESLGKRFADYRAIIEAEGLPYSREDSGSLLPHASVARVIAALKSGGFAVVSPEARVALKAYRAAAELSAERARARMDRIEKSTGWRFRGFQRAGVEWLATRRAALLADDMGLGKTAQTLAAVDDGSPLVVVCPSVAVGPWLDGLSTLRPEYKVTVASKVDDWCWPKPNAATLVTYGALPLDAGQSPPGAFAVVDEAHWCANPRAQRTVKTAAVVASVTEAGGRTVGLTATPILNDPGDLWGVLKLLRLDAEAFGSWRSFLRIMDGTAGEFGGATFGPNPDTAEAASRLRRVSLRRTKDEVLSELPAKTYRDVVVELDEQSSLRLCDEALAALGLSGIDVESASEDAAWFDVIEFESMSRARKALALAKIAATMELAEELRRAGEPAVVFTAFPEVADAFAAMSGWRAITGDTPTRKRADHVKAYQDGAIHGLALTIRAGGVAITLTRGCHVLVNDREWTPALNTQAEDRVHRMTQTRPVTVTRIIANHLLDRRMSAILDRKSGIIRGSVGAAERKTHDRLPSIVSEIDALFSGKRS